MSATDQCIDLESDATTGLNDGVIGTTANVLSSIDGLRVLYDPPVERGRTGRFHSLHESSLCGSLTNHLFEQFPNGLYTHQHDAIESVLAGQNTVLSTRTSSKALANDQLIKLRDMARTIPVKIVVTEPGYGYSSQPTATVAGFDGVKLDVKLQLSTDLKKNGAVATVEVME